MARSWNFGGAWALAQHRLFNNLITGGFRVGVSASLVVKMLAHAGGVAENAIAQRLAGNCTPSAEAF